MAVIKRNKIAGKEHSGNILTSLAERPTAAEFGEGELLISTSTYKIRCESNSVSWTSHGSGPIADRPSAALFGVGAWQDGLVEYKCDSKGWGNTLYTKLNNASINRTSTIWRYPLSSTGPYDSSYFVYVPIDNIGNYSYFGLGNWLASEPCAKYMAKFGLSRIGTQVLNGGMTKVGTWAASTPAGVYYALTQSSTAGNTISTTVTGHTVVLHTATVTNGGYGIVSIDGDYTIANRLPMFTAADFAAGLCRSTDVGKRYFNTGSNGVYPDYFIPLAEGLTDTAHTVVIEVTGTKPADVGAGARVYVGSLVGCSLSDADFSPDGTTRLICPIEPVCDWFSGGGSALHYTPEIEQAGAVFVANTASTTTLTITSVTSGTVKIGQTVSGAGIPIGATIGSFGTFTVVAGTGTVILSLAATATATGVTINANGIFEFIGEIHDSETPDATTPFTINIDGIDYSQMAAGAYASGSTISIDTKSTLASKDMPGTPVALKRFSHTFSAYQPTYQLTTKWRVDWLVAKRCRSSYPLMLPMLRGKSSHVAVENTRWNQAEFGEYVSIPTDFSANDNSTHGSVYALSAKISSTLHNVNAEVAYLDNGESINYGVKSAPNYAFLSDRSDFIDKIYLGSRSSTTNYEYFEIGDSIKGVVGFSISL